MATIKLKRGTSAPTTSNIVDGEIAVDKSSQKLYIRDGSTIKELGRRDSVPLSGGTMTGSLTVGADDTGHDVKFFGATSGSYMLWDEDVDDLILAGAARIVIPDGQLVLGSTAVSSTAAELNILDGVTATATELNYSDTGAAVGTVVASKVVTADANKDASSFRNVTLTGALTAASLDISGDIDVAGGTINLGTANTSSAHINSYELMTFNIDSDNDDTDRYFKWLKNGNSGGGTELMRLDESGHLGLGSGGAVALNDADIALQVGSSSSSTPTLQLRSGTSGTGKLWFGDNSGSDAGRYDGFVEYGQTDRYMRFGTASTERMRLNATGLGIGTTSPSSLLHLEAAGSPTLRIVDTTNDATLLAYAQDSEAVVGTYSNHSLSLFANSSRALMLDSSQRSLYGHTSSQSFVWSSVQPRFQMEGTNASTSALSITRNDNGGSPPYLILAKSRGAAVNSNTIVQDDDQTGSIMFVAADGTDRLTRTATIDSFVDGTPGSNDMPGRLVFSTTQDGNVDPTIALTLDASQKATFAGSIDAAGLELTHSSDNGFKVTATDTAGNTPFAAMRLDYNASGSDTLTADRAHIGLEIDVDSSASGGDTSNEHRLYGVWTHTKATGDSDLIYGGYFHGEASQSTGTVTSTYGVFGRAESDVEGGGASNAYGAYGYATVQNDAGVGTTNAYGVYGKTLLTSTNVADAGQLVGVYGEVELSDPGSGSVEIDKIYAFQAQIDNNDTGTVHLDIDNTESYLYYGNYAGTQPGNAYGVYIADTVPNYFAGNVDIGTTLTVSQEAAIGNAVVSGVGLTIREDSTTNVADFRNANASGYGLYSAGGSGVGQYALRAANKDLTNLFSVFSDGDTKVHLGGFKVEGSRTSPGSTPYSTAVNAVVMDYASDGARFWSHGSSTARGTYSFIQLENDGQNQQTPLTIDASGNVGLNITGPTETLTVNGDSNVIGQMYIGPNDNDRRPFAKKSNWGYSTQYKAIILGSTSTTTTTAVEGSTTVSFGYDPSTNDDSSFSGDGREIIFRRGQQFVTPNSANDDFNLYNLVLKDGNVGIGVASPDVMLHVQKGGEPDAAGILILEANSGGRQIRFSPPSDSANGYIDFRGGNLTFRDDGSEVARFAGSGVVGIGTDNPDSLLHVAGPVIMEEFEVRGAGNANNRLKATYNSQNGNAVFGPHSTGGSTALYIGTSNSGTFATKLTIAHDGDHTIDSTGDYPLQVVTSQNAARGVRVQNSNTGTSARAMLQTVAESASLSIYATSALNATNDWADAGVLTTDSTTSGGLVFNTQASGSSIRFQYAGNNWMTIGASGSVGIGTTPTTESHTTWNHLYIGKKGILFSERLGSGGYYGTYLTDNIYIDKDTGAYAALQTDEGSAFRLHAGNAYWYTFASATAGAAATATTTMTLGTTGVLTLNTGKLVATAGATNSSMYALDLTRSGSGTSPDLWGGSNNLVLGSASDKGEIRIQTDNVTVYGRAEGFHHPINTDRNFAIGDGTGDNFESGAYRNMVIGYHAGQSLTTGDQNTFIGYDAGINAKTSSVSTAVGYQAGRGVSTGTDGAAAEPSSGITAVGYRSGYKSEDEAANGTYIGREAGHGITTGYQNTAVGAYALHDIAGAHRNAAFGYIAGQNLDGNAGYNTLLGGYVMSTATQSSNCVAIGYLALRGHTTSTPGTGDNNVAIGQQAMYYYTTGQHNVSVGHHSGFNLTTGSHNVFMGYYAGNDMLRASNNVAIGSVALDEAQYDHSNVAVGYGTLTHQRVYSDHASQDHTYNVAVGHEAGYELTTGVYNTFLGAKAGNNVLGGTNNTLLGWGAGNDITTGDYNICIGRSTIGGAADSHYRFTIGYNISCSEDSQVTIGRDGAVIRNEFDTDAAWTQSSDVRKKRNIQTDTLGLDFINELRPVTFQWKPSNEHPKSLESYSETNTMNLDATIHGLIAQEVKEAMDKVGAPPTFSGWKEDSDGSQSISREMMVTPLINAVKELSSLVKTLQAEVEELKKK